MYQALNLNQVTLSGQAEQRQSLAYRYMMSLDNSNLLQNYYWQAGIVHNAILRETGKNPDDRGDGMHWGWESPMCQLRGHFLGHWLSGAYRMAVITGSSEIKAKADTIVAELARCQKRNGGQWCGSIPEQYLYWIAKGQHMWAPHYVVHKTFMGLIDAVRFGHNEQALDILNNWAKWFTQWTSQLGPEQMEDIFDIETGGMMEAWADLYAITGKQEHLELMLRYQRRRLFERLLQGEDCLTNMHANTTIPEAHGAARAYEVTGDKRWRDIAEAYWKCAVTDRGFFCTGGQTSGEIWTPPFAQAARLSDKNQEHCVVYNMIRLADYLYRWSGDVVYHDYIERNLYNGILSQQHPQTGLVAYFQPLAAGSKKLWGSPTHDFWCCHGSSVQAHTLYNQLIYYKNQQGYTISQFLPSTLKDTLDDTTITIEQRFDTNLDIIKVHIGDGPVHRPDCWTILMQIKADKPKEFTLTLRLPWWIAGEAEIYLNGALKEKLNKPSSTIGLKQTWKEDTIRLVLPKNIYACPLPDEPQTVAFMDGPLVLAGLCDEQRTLHGDSEKPETILAPDNERQWKEWLPDWRTVNQPVNFRFKPLKNITSETYTVYFPVRK
jgi:hypothetical protein